MKLEIGNNQGHELFQCIHQEKNYEIFYIFYSIVDVKSLAVVQHIAIKGNKRIEKKHGTALVVHDFH